MISVSVKSLLVFLLLAFSAAAQTTNDTLLQIIAKASEQSKSPRYAPVTRNLKSLAVLYAADSLAKATGNIAAQADLDEELGDYTRKDADKRIAYNLDAYRLFTEIDNKKRAAQCLHNIAFAYDEQKHDMPEAVKYTTLAIQARTELKDTLSMANMYKYLGYLQGKTHYFGEAKQNAVEAIRLYTLKRYMPGVAVSYRDLSIVYEEEHKPDSSIACIMIAKKIWEEKENNDTNRLFNANNILLRVYTADDRLHDAEIIFRENEAMMNSNAMRNLQRAYMDILDYYTICQAYFSKKKDKKLAKEYKAKYNAFKDTLTQQGFSMD